MPKLRIYINKEPEEVGKCTHNTEVGTPYYLEAEYAAKYNHCVFCAIDAFNGPMPHQEIANCLGIERMRVCQIEKKAFETVKKRMLSSPVKKACKYIDSCLVKVSGLADRLSKDVIVNILQKMCDDFNIQKPVDLSFTRKQIHLNSKPGKAIYESKNNHHKILINSTLVLSKKDLIDTMLHEVVHAADYERQVPNATEKLSEILADAIVNECSNKYYKTFLSLFKESQAKMLLGEKRR